MAINIALTAEGKQQIGQQAAFRFASMQSILKWLSKLMLWVYVEKPEGFLNAAELYPTRLVVEMPSHKELGALLGENFGKIMEQVCRDFEEQIGGNVHVELQPTKIDNPLPRYVPVKIGLDMDAKSMPEDMRVTITNKIVPLPVTMNPPKGLTIEDDRETYLILDVEKALLEKLSDMDLVPEFRSAVKVAIYETTVWDKVRGIYFPDEHEMVFVYPVQARLKFADPNLEWLFQEYSREAAALFEGMQIKSYIDRLQDLFRAIKSSDTNKIGHELIESKSTLKLKAGDHGPKLIGGLPNHIVEFLVHFIPRSILEKVRLYEGLPSLTKKFSFIDPAAYTSDYNVYFATGEYDPQTCRGVALIAHETLHVVQDETNGLYEIEYVMEFVHNLLQDNDNDKAYRNITFEREAYEFQAWMDAILKKYGDCK